MPRATDELLKDHRIIRKALEGFTLENPSFPHVLKTLHRLVVGHAWFEDTIFLPALATEPRLARLDREIGAEHKDLDQIARLLRKTDLSNRKDLEIYPIQLRSILETHFRKEEDALFPLAERILDSEGLNRLGEEMVRRRTEVRGPVGDLE